MRSSLIKKIQYRFQITPNSNRLFLIYLNSATHIATYRQKIRRLSCWRTNPVSAAKLALVSTTQSTYKYHGPLHASQPSTAAYKIVIFFWNYISIFSTGESNENTLTAVNGCLWNSDSYKHYFTVYLFFTFDKGGGKCFCPRSSVCLLARLLKNACMDLDEMLHVDRCRDMDELINFWARSGL